MTDKQTQKEIKNLIRAITKTRVSINGLKLDFNTFYALKVPDDFGIDDLADPLLEKLERICRGLMQTHQEIENHINGISTTTEDGE